MKKAVHLDLKEQNAMSFAGSVKKVMTGMCFDMVAMKYLITFIMYC